jgi:CBS domain-containing protein
VRVEDIMTREVHCCTRREALGVPARIMWEHDCGSVPVLEDDGSGRVVGMITDRDLCMAAYTRNEPLSRMPVRDVMAREIHCCRTDDDESAVHAAMRAYQVRRLPVVDADGRLQGIVSLNDLALQAATNRTPVSAKRQREVAKTLTEISRHREMAAI